MDKILLNLSEEDKVRLVLSASKAGMDIEKDLIPIMSKVEDIVNDSLLMKNIRYMDKLAGVGINMTSKFNASGCRDETAYQAINNITQEDRKLDKKAYGVIKLAKDLIRFAGFDLLERIAIVDKETRKEYR